MSGHSKWHNIKRKKEISDKKKSAVFTRLAKEIKSAAKEGGSDPSANASLRDAIDRAKKANLPQANIERILNKSQDANLQEATYEAIGPAGVALLITTTTDNVNRTVAEVRAILKKHNATLGSPGSITWKFEPQTVIDIENITPDNKEDIELALIDAGATDIKTEGTTMTVTAAPEDKTKLEEAIKKLDLPISVSGITLNPTNTVSIPEKDQETFDVLIEELESHDDVESVVTDAVS